MGAVGGWWWVGEQVVDLSGDVSFQAADDLSAGFAFGLAFLDVCDGGRVVAHTNRCDAPECVVGLAVAAAVEPVSYGLPGGRLDGTCAAQGSEGRFRLHAVGVVTGCNQQRRSGVWADSGSGEQRGVGSDAETVHLGVEFFDLGGERLIAAGQETECFLA